MSIRLFSLCKVRNFSTEKFLGSRSDELESLCPAKTVESNATEGGKRDNLIQSPTCHGLLWVWAILGPSMWVPATIRGVRLLSHMPKNTPTGTGGGTKRRGRPQGGGH